MELEHFTTLLLAEKERLEKELASIATPDPKMPGNWDTKFPEREEGGSDYSSGAMEEQSNRREEFEANVAGEHSLESRLSEVVGALKRMADGAYGICTTCGEAIPEERLLANPAAHYDMGHQPKE